MMSKAVTFVMSAGYLFCRMSLHSYVSDTSLWLDSVIRSLSSVSATPWTAEYADSEYAFFGLYIFEERWGALEITNLQLTYSSCL